MKLISWNVNGLRAVLNKGFDEFLNKISPDIICLQEIKLSSNQLDYNPEGYQTFFNYAGKKGYSGTAVFTKIKPLSNHFFPDAEGRITYLEYEKFFLVCVYVPNSQEGLKRLDYRLKWDEKFKEFLLALKKIKPVVVCGDFNVAHNEIDIKNPKSNLRNAGFTIEERDSFSSLLSSGFTDSFRFLHPDLIKYSWWSYRFNSREKNVGWRIDYFLVSESLIPDIKTAEIYTEVLGSDHAPVLLELF